VTALGASLDAAVDGAYRAVGRVSFDGMHYRKDIGRRAIARLHGAGR
jgi:phosphoribosylamine--glycine ligase